MPEDLRATAERWIANDPDPGTRAELQALLDDERALKARFSAPLSFGTAGIRGALGAGPARMNRAVVRRVSAGLSARLRADGPDSRSRPRRPATGRVVVVGRDARHMSREFAADVAGVLAAAGFDVRVFEDPVPTPLVAFAVRHLEAAAGVQITASHNPPSDNGYKVYWAGGAQIVEPLDTEISAAIQAAPGADEIPVDERRPRPLDTEALIEAYLDSTLQLARHPDHRELSVVTTPLHGVAGDLLATTLRRAGFADVTVVAEQAAPDPDFPTVTFPNPEEPGALDLALDLAGQRDADLVIANDPDGDRIAAAIPSAGGWRMLSGDETGCLLAEYLLSGGSDGAERLVATTVVSSQLLRRIAEHHGAVYAETLTGFKWLARAAVEGESRGQRFVVGYEQALGVMIGTAVLDKDGISAALVFADLAAHLKAEGRAVADALDDLARRHGVHATAGRSVRLEGREELVGQVLERLRREPPAKVGGVAVSALADYANSTRRRADGSTVRLDVPATDMVGLGLADGSRLQVRPSGTEPLLKFYVEVVEPVGDEPVDLARNRASERLQRLTDAFLRTAGV